jgi:hypothetical protein
MSERSASPAAPLRHTLRAPAAAVARVRMVLPVEVAAPVPSPARQAYDKTVTDPELAARRKERNERRNALFMRLREIAPTLFVTIPPPPMAIGVYDVIVARLGLDAEAAHDLRVMLGHHTHRVAYQKRLAAGAVRLDLDGMPAGEVTEEQRQIAAKKLDRLKAKAEAAKARDGK